MPNFKGAVAALAALSLGNHATSESDKVVQSDTYFYGQSPAVYPTPEISGIGGWEEALHKAQAMVSQMSLEEKVNLTGGYENSTTACGGNIRAVNRLGFPGMCLHDGPIGVRGTEGVNGYPSNIHIGVRYDRFVFCYTHITADIFKLEQVSCL